MSFYHDLYGAAGEEQPMMVPAETKKQQGTTGKSTNFRGQPVHNRLIMFFHIAVV